MNCILTVKVAETLLAMTVAILFMIPQTLNSKRDGSSNVMYVTMKNVFCFLQPVERKGTKESAISSLGLPAGDTISQKFSDIVLCLESDEVKRDEKECLCLNNFWWIAMNIIVALFVALAFATFVILRELRCVRWSTRGQKIGLVICSLAITGGCMVVGAFDIVLLSSSWLFKYHRKELSGNYYDPPATWCVVVGLWAAFGILSTIEPFMYLSKITDSDVSKSEVKVRHRSSTDSVRSRRSNDSNKGQSVRKTTKQPIRKISATKGSSPSSPTSSKSSRSSKSPVGDVIHVDENKPIRLVPHHHAHHRDTSRKSLR